ncbi:MAG: fibronectin type III domain-containing protein [Lachnospiraceae bacterium]
MRQTKKQAISWMLILVMVFSVISPGSVWKVKAEEAYDGYVYVTVERFTLGQGLAEEPMKIGYYETESLEDILKRGLGDNMVFTESSWGAYFSGYVDGGEPEGWTADRIPEKIKEKLDENEVTISTRAQENTLSGGDYTGQSSFMFSVDNLSAQYGMSGITYEKDTEDGTSYHDGTVIRLQFGIYNYSDDLNISYSEPLIAFPDKDDLIKAVADYTGDKQNTAYQNAVTVLEDWDATEDEVDSAIEQISKAELSNNYIEKYNATVQNIKKQLAEPEYGNEWQILSVARSGIDDVVWYKKYYASVENQIKEKQSNILNSSYSTENSRLIIGLTAIGADPADISGYNLIAPLADFDFVKKQGLNGSVYALIALDCGGYEISVAEEGVTQTTREGIIEEILNSALETGGWTYSGDTADPDMTSMAIQALAPYYTQKDDVKVAVDKALTVLSDMQDENGSFASWGTTNSMSCAQVVCAVSALGSDVETDTRFIKNGISVLDAMLSFYDESTAGFKYSLSEESAAGYATAQAAYALTAYDRLKKKQNSLYDMSDATKQLYICAHPEDKTKLQNAKEATCTEEGYTGDKVCAVCGETIEKGKVIPKKDHTIVVDSAVAPTETTEGKTEGKHCSVCNTVIVAQETIPKLITTEQQTEQQTEQTAAEPKKTSVSKVQSPAKKQIKVTWKKKSGVAGYEIQVSTSSKFKKSLTKTYKISTAKTTSKTIKSLKSGKKYYVRIRTYNTATVNGKKTTVYSKWSAKKSVKVK